MFTGVRARESETVLIHHEGKRLLQGLPRSFGSQKLEVKPMEERRQQKDLKICQRCHDPRLACFD
jgi:hypothetical protein